MVLSAAERQVRYRIKRYAQLEALSKIQCACGCSELIPPVNKQGKPATYKHGHNPSGLETRFVKGQVSFNKGRRGLWAYPNPMRGKKLTLETIQKRTASRLANNGGVYQKSGWKAWVDLPLSLALITKINKEKALHGADNPAWLGGKSFEEYGNDFTDSLKQDILKRDGWRCVKCGADIRQIRLVVHHKDVNKKNNNPTNLQTLCESCHGRLHGKVLQNYRVASGVI